MSAPAVKMRPAAASTIASTEKAFAYGGAGLAEMAAWILALTQRAPETVPVLKLTTGYRWRISRPESV